MFLNVKIEIFKFNRGLTNKEKNSIILNKAKKDYTIFTNKFLNNKKIKPI